MNECTQTPWSSSVLRMAGAAIVRVNKECTVFTFSVDFDRLASGSLYWKQPRRQKQKTEPNFNSIYKHLTGSGSIKMYQTIQTVNEINRRPSPRAHFRFASFGFKIITRSTVIQRKIAQLTTINTRARAYHTKVIHATGLFRR